MVRLVFIAVFLVGLANVIPAGATAVFGQEGVKITVFPNPFKSVFSIQAERHEFPAKIVVTDILGKVVYQKSVFTPQRVDIDLSKKRLTSGVYFLNWKSKDNSKTVRIVKS
jgi:hypothetical protein